MMPLLLLRRVIFVVMMMTMIIVVVLITPPTTRCQLLPHYLVPGVVFRVQARGFEVLRQARVRATPAAEDTVGG